MIPAHLVLFRATAREIARRALALDQAQTGATPTAGEPVARQQKTPRTRGS